VAVVNEEHRYGKNSAETFADLEKAIAMMGTISKTDPGALLIEGKIKFGMGAKTKEARIAAISAHAFIRHQIQRRISTTPIPAPRSRLVCQA